MDKKNTMLLTVIAVATLLVAVVGATFAFFSVTSQTATSANTKVTTTAQDVGVVSLTTTTDNLYLKLSAAQMANTTAAKVPYYATTADEYATTAGPDAAVTEIAKFTVEGGDTGVNYKCTFNYTIKTTEANNDAAALAVLKADGDIVISVDGNVTGIANTYNLGEDVTNGTGTVTLIGNADAPVSATVSAYAVFNNTGSDQTAMAGASFTTDVDITGLSCDTIA